MTGRGLAILGAGASGLMAAVSAAGLLGRKETVLLAEGSPKAGKKLLATGNGRCNLTNLELSPAHYHGDKLAAQVLEKFPTSRILKAFENMGLLTRADPEGRVYPLGNQAAAVLNVLHRFSGCAGELCGFQAVSVEKRGESFLLKSGDGQTVEARRLILACGGRASPSHSTGCGYDLAKALGHTVTNLTPSLVPLETPSKACGALKGMRARARAALLCNGKVIRAESGEVIFGVRRLSGICIFNLSACLRETGLRNLEVSLDLLESMDFSQVLAYLQALQKDHPGLPASELFSGALNLRVGQELLKGLGLTKERPLSSVSQSELRRAAERAKDWRFPISGTGSWEDAQVTAGGVPLGEVDLDTMESKVCPGLYLAGELLDVDGDCGGYNLHWAWATGITAGESAARALLRDRGRNIC